MIYIYNHTRFIERKMMLRRLILRATFSISRNFNIVPPCFFRVNELKFQEIDKDVLKVYLDSHLSLNETCMNNKLLLTFTNIYIYI